MITNYRLRDLDYEISCRNFITNTKNYKRRYIKYLILTQLTCQIIFYFIVNIFKTRLLFNYLTITAFQIFQAINLELRLKSKMENFQRLNSIYIDNVTRTHNK